MDVGGRIGEGVDPLDLLLRVGAQIGGEVERGDLVERDGIVYDAVEEACLREAGSRQSFDVLHDGFRGREGEEADLEGEIVVVALESFEGFGIDPFCGKIGVVRWMFLSWEEKEEKVCCSCGVE